jgi:hypothetical protein
METNNLKKILIELLKEEAYGACDVQNWVETSGIVFKPMATSDELEKRVDFFIKRNKKVKKYCV